MLLRHLDPPGDLDRVEQQAHLLGFHDGRDAHLTAEPGTLDEQGRVFRNDLLDDELVEQATQRSKMLLDGRRGHRLGLDIGGDMQRPDCGEPKIVLFAPAEELGCGRHIRCARVAIADGGGEEFEEMLAGFITGCGDDCRHRKIRRKHGGCNFDAWFFHKLHVRSCTNRTHDSQPRLNGQSDYDP